MASVNSARPPEKTLPADAIIEVMIIGGKAPASTTLMLVTVVTIAAGPTPIGVAVVGFSGWAPTRRALSPACALAGVAVVRGLNAEPVRVVEVAADIGG